MSRLSRIALAFALLALGAGAAQAADTNYKFGYVDAARLLDEAPQAQQATNRLKKEFSSREDALNKEGEEIKTMEDRLNKDGPIMSDAERKKMGLDILSRKRELRRKQDEFREDVNIRRSEVIGNLQELIKQTIQQVGTDGKYDLIFYDGIAFANPKLDVTDEVLQGLKKRYEAPSAGTKR